MEFCLVMKVRKHSPEIGGKKRKDSVWGAGLPSLSLVSWATSSMHLPFIAPAAETWILLIGGGHYKKDTKNIKEIDRSFFEMLKPRHNSTFFSISSFERKTGANVPAGSRTVQQRDLCWGKEAELHHEVTREFRERETWFLCPSVLPVFRHYAWHMPFNLSVPQLLHLESEEH